MERDRSEHGRVVVLNGGSSSGKTALARRLQAAFDGTWVVLGVDLFLWMLPSRLFADPAGIGLEDGVISRGEEYMRVHAVFQRAAAALAENGVDVLVDDVFLDGADDQRAGPSRWATSPCVGSAFAAIRTSQRDVRSREAIASSERHAHKHTRSTNGCGTTSRSTRESSTSSALADAVVGRLRERWPELGLSTSEGPYAYPLTSSWTASGSIRPAPWERRPTPTPDNRHSCSARSSTCAGLSRAGSAARRGTGTYDCFWEQIGRNASVAPLATAIAVVIATLSAFVGVATTYRFKVAAINGADVDDLQRRDTHLDKHEDSSTHTCVGNYIGVVCSDARQALGVNAPFHGSAI